MRDTAHRYSQDTEYRIRDLKIRRQETEEWYSTLMVNQLATKEEKFDPTWDWFQRSHHRCSTHLRSQGTFMTTLETSLIMVI
ncbi:uncharacterized protein NDAI_0F00880 [Naumovozyma dairenensis CBS 421]|uniref:Uncharacterized protein n=1 Tax=Naumovozyma dairenensis (strain ATCC 10597 / BCRC 20456 / CBS 421 / NBRC 0211 / NRRL Y-12639) TaxID=1071378 RepID=G0WC96_NAUDC|nr:hypothetical protein NDAI_0F00880 [Naumovozyma dairenensis CBS 421]CCD25407.1 hypothetical protein NDAI_0F00880 [Naumovozyma dairenensis CBS 421]